MFLVRDADYGCIWDFRSDRTLSIFGSAGAGKTILARHIVKTWIECNGTVLVGSRFHGAPYNSDYEDLADLIHLDTVENVIGYGRTLESVPHEGNVLIVVDDWSGISDEDAEYLDSKPPSSVSWVIIRQRPRSHQFFDNICVGQMNYASAAIGFGHDHGIEDPHRIGRGVVTRPALTGTDQMTVPSDATKPMRNSGLYTRRPLPLLPKRLWYAA